MRLPSIVVSALLAGATLAAAGSAAAQSTYVVNDRSATYTVPVGITVIPNATGPADEAIFAITRGTGSASHRAGICVMRISALQSRPSDAAWSMLIAQNRNNTEQMARARVKPPAEFVSLGGYKDLTVGSAKGYGFWYSEKRQTGQVETKLTFAVVMMPDRLYSAECASTLGMTFTADEVDRIFRLAVSVRRP